jgi:putative membrane protein
MYHGYGNMWGMYWFWWVLWIVLVVIIVWLLVRSRQPAPPPPSSRPSPLELLQQRYARGEISTEEYRERKHELETNR